MRHFATTIDKYTDTVVADKTSVDNESVIIIPAPSSI